MQHLIPALILATLTACGGQQPPSAEACAQYAGKPAAAGSGTAAAPAAGPTLSAFEQSLVGPVLDDVRAGVRPFGDEAIGVCAGERNCDKFIGMKAEDLPPGKYMLQALLRVPKTGDKGSWKIDFSTECTTTKNTSSGETSTTSSSTQSYEVYYAGEERPFRLAPLRTITSPDKGGARACTYTIVAPHPDGDKIYKGSWSVPADAN